jgi:hypothetical protein
MREKAKVIELDISDETKAAIKNIQERIFDKKRRAYNIRFLLGHSLCCICATGVPSVKLEYDLHGFKP